MDIKALRQRKADLTAEGTAIFEAANKNGGVMTDEQKARDDAIETELAQLNDQITRAERQMERERSAPAIVRGREEAAVTEALPAYGRLTAEARRAMLMGAPETTGFRGQPFQSFGEQMRAISSAARTVGVAAPDSRLVMAASGASEGSPSDGGFLVQVDYSTELLRRMYEFGQISNRVRRIPISSNANGLKVNAINETSRATGSRWGGIRGYWAAEAGTLTGSQPKFRQIELDLKKLTGLCYATDELLADAAALESILMQGFAEEFSFLIEDAIVEGDGSGKPLGILNSVAKVAQAKETGQQAATIVFENIQNMWARMFARNRQNAVWLINQDCEPQLNGMSLVVGTGGIPVYLPPGGLSSSPFAVLMGRPVIPVEYCSALGTEGDIILCDLSEYVMIDKGAIQQASSIHVRFLNDEMTYRFIYRCDGQPTWNSALTPFKGSLTKSPYVTLATRA